MRHAESRANTLVMALCISVFMLNDLLFVISDFRAWLAADYVSRLAVIAACLAAPFRGQIRELCRAPGRMGWLLCLASIPLDVALDHFLRATLPDDRVFSYPVIPDGGWLIADTLLGIPLVALSEELVARAAFLVMAERASMARWLTVVLSSLLFAAFHWSLGWASMVSAVAFGAAAMGMLMATRSLWPALIAHWAIDIALFSLPMWMLK